MRAGLKETTEKLVKKKLEGKDKLTPWEEFLEKKKEKKKQKKSQRKQVRNETRRRLNCGADGKHALKPSQRCPEDLKLFSPSFKLHNHKIDQPAQLPTAVFLNQFVCFFNFRRKKTKSSATMSSLQTSTSATRSSPRSSPPQVMSAAHTRRPISCSVLVLHRCHKIDPLRPNTRKTPEQIKSRSLC